MMPEPEIRLDGKDCVEADGPPDTIPFEPYRKIARDPLPKGYPFGRRKSRAKPKGGMEGSAQDGDVL